MKINEQIEARKLRQKGYSLNEISRTLRVSKSSTSLWVRNVELSSEAKKKIADKFTAGQLASQDTKRKQTILKESEAQNLAVNVLNHYSPNINLDKILCAMIYYCEGNKIIKDGMRFTNSDPLLITAFLKLFRSTFILNEKKFRVCVHLHNYHDEDTQLKFWSKTAKIPLNQFIKSYKKKNSGLYKKEGYQGCVSIRYAGAKIARELKAIAVEFMNKGL
ncbi:MAG: hypothetical protein A2832_02470 [Candidatus Zambryskibacteria bacterium RIFCSPHIGHO2_01_FULL_44_22b]|uniref:Uncharacterized protein n=2 Tax=Candidatus Zambryskiibacteriota TaxID=1817925 RepID=A0A1G2SZC6_9BACT|nr:MAG: hypothetical protein A2832_02470 [Candidatus Zambryskibacteria bacterium RIFCSPHIGHO2_01_FULL_44_22b]OHB06363.1 MAG: hypothetical protein A3B16_02125 [Candidatus Zambryskibacteria bacterium RIFCSPLOWO2_01_FULL_45_43]